MATNSKRVIKRDDFIKSVRPDVKSTEALMMLQGYIGDSDLAGHVRVYFDPSLSDFIELPEQDILYSDPVKTEEDPLGGSRLWVRKTTVFTTGDPNQVNRIKSSFLEGDLMTAFGSSGAAQAFSPQDAGGLGYHTQNPTCPSVGNTACITNNHPCPSVGICPTSLQVIQCTNVVTIYRPTCFRTCFNPTCFRTCFNPTCYFTCNRPTCFRTCFRTCQYICQVAFPHTKYCEVAHRFPEDIPGPFTGPGFQGGYGGGFNPYETANFGY